METSLDNLTIEEIMRDIFKFRNDINTQYLESYYSAPSYAEILGVSRKEICHSNFLAWILNNNESHLLSNFPIKKFLEVLVQHCKGNQLSNNKELFDAIVTDDISLRNLTLEREKSLGEVGKLDLYAEMQVTFSRQERKIRLIIENKVKSKEHSDQTLKYFNYFEQIKRPGEINIYVFLTPISGIDLVELTEPECSCKKFIQINYQALVDSILQPILNRNISDKTKMIVLDYLQSLSQPSIDLDNDFKQGIIMAIGNEERELLKKFWEKNQKLILTALYAISSDPDQEKDDREIIKDAIGRISNNTRDRSLYSIFMDGKEESVEIKKSNIGYETIQILDRYDAINDGNFKLLREDKSCSFKLLKRKDEVTETEEKYGKYRTRNRPELVYKNEEYYVARSWGADNTKKFISKMKKNFPGLKYETHK